MWRVEEVRDFVNQWYYSKIILISSSMFHQLDCARPTKHPIMHETLFVIRRANSLAFGALILFDINAPCPMTDCVIVVSGVPGIVVSDITVVR